MRRAASSSRPCWDLFHAKTVNDLPKSVRDNMKSCLMLSPSLPQWTVLLRLLRNGAQSFHIVVEVGASKFPSHETRQICYNITMFNSRYRLCELFGIPIYVNFSFILLLLIFMTDFGSFSFGLAAALVLAISVTLHELGHALTARAFGYRTKDITLSLLGGCASLIALPRKAWQELLTAAAGPLVSFALAALAYLALALGVITNHWLARVFAYTFWMNVMLGGFNLLPGFPMDGGRIFRSVMRAFMSRAQATLVAMWVGRAFAILLGLRGFFSIFNGGGWGFVSIMIAWMIWQEGFREYLAAKVEEDFRHWTQEDFNAKVSPPPYERK